MGRQVVLEFEGNQELMGCLGQEDLEVLMAVLVQQGHLDQLGLEEHRGSQGRQEVQVE